MTRPDGTLEGLYRHLRHTLKQAGIETAELESRLLLEHYAGFAWADLIARSQEAVLPDALKSIENALERRLQGEPLSRIFGEREFWGLRFALSPDTLDPRPDTETLVEAALARFKDNPPHTILDLGTGTGCILISLLTEWRKSTGTGVDKAQGALETARKNAQTLGVADRASFICGNWADSLEQKFDLIVSNPPYIRNQVIANLDSGVRNHDPILALDGGTDGLDAYKIIITAIERILKPGGRVFFEIGYDQLDDITRLVEKSMSRIEAVYPDIAGIPRVVEISRGDK